MDQTTAARALASPRRREVLRLLLEGQEREGRSQPTAKSARRHERTAGDLHRAFPDAVTFGAISQHLRVLLDAGLVEARREGRHRYYSARREAIEAHLPWLRELWRDALYRLKLEVELEHSRRGPRPEPNDNEEES